MTRPEQRLSSPHPSIESLRAAIQLADDPTREIDLTSGEEIVTPDPDESEDE